jgi:hypothetical protein
LLTEIDNEGKGKNRIVAANIFAGACGESGAGQPGCGPARQTSRPKLPHNISYGKSYLRFLSKPLKTQRFWHHLGPGGASISARPARRNILKNQAFSITASYASTPLTPSWSSPELAKIPSAKALCAAIFFTTWPRGKRYVHFHCILRNSFQLLARLRTRLKSCSSFVLTQKFHDNEHRRLMNCSVSPYSRNSSRIALSLHAVPVLNM